MNDATTAFNRLRPRLQGIAYRMLGSSSEAEDVVQMDSTEAWLVSVTTRLAIDRLRSAKIQREHYVGTWLPEPLMSDAPVSPEQLLERVDDVSVAFMTLLERLAPEARGKTEPACRQLVHRAKVQLQDQRPRYTVARETQLRLLRGFADAAARGNFHELKDMLADDAQLYLATFLRFPGVVQFEVVVLNGQWGLLRFIDGVLESAQSLETDGERIVRIHSQRNPDKLARIVATLDHHFPQVLPSHGWCQRYAVQVFTRPRAARAGAHACVADQWLCFLPGYACARSAQGGRGLAAYQQRADRA